MMNVKHQRGAIKLSAHENRRIDVEHLIEGSRLRSPILDKAGQILLQADVEITEEFRDSLRKRGIEFVEIATSAPSQPRSDSKKNDAKTPVKNRRVDRHQQSYCPERARKFARALTDATVCVERLGSQIANFSANKIDTGSVDTIAAKALPQVLLDHLVDDSDQMLASASSYQTEVNFADRCGRMCVLSMETAVEMGSTESEVLAAGTGALLHDIGLYSGPIEFRNPSAILLPNQSWEYRKHPRVAERVLSQVTDCGPEICRIVTQVHERMDGSGYPDCLAGNRIHPAAKIIGTVDAYLTLTTAGPGRPAMTPHDAMNYLLIDAMRGCLDNDVVEAFAANLCLFPINSKVVLQDGREAIVRRRNFDQCAAPFVTVGDDEELVATDSPATTIAAPIVDTSTGQMRISNEIMKDLSWAMIDSHPALTN